jgi:hypothetical protein
MLVSHESDKLTFNPQNKVHTKMNEKTSGVASSTHPPLTYFVGWPLHDTVDSSTAVTSVDMPKRANPRQSSRPRMPAVAPAKQAERNFVVLILVL